MTQSTVTEREVEAGLRFVNRHVGRIDYCEAPLTRADLVRGILQAAATARKTKLAAARVRATEGKD